MNKTFILGLIFGCLVVAGGYFAIADEEQNQLAITTSGVETSAGETTLAAGTFIGGNPENFITLSEVTQLHTTEGIVTYPIGTVIDCDHEPNEPDPCGLS